MTYDPNRRRRSIRLRGYDYTSPGSYFVTICTHERAALLDDWRCGGLPRNSGKS